MEVVVVVAVVVACVADASFREGSYQPLANSPRFLPNQHPHPPATQPYIQGIQGNLPMCHKAPIPALGLALAELGEIKALLEVEILGKQRLVGVEIVLGYALRVPREDWWGGAGMVPASAAVVVVVVVGAGVGVGVGGAVGVGVGLGIASFGAVTVAVTVTVGAGVVARVGGGAGAGARHDWTVVMMLMLMLFVDDYAVRQQCAPSGSWRHKTNLTSPPPNSKVTRPPPPQRDETR